MNRFAGSVRLVVCAVLGVAVCASVMGGCDSLGGIFGVAGGGLTVTATSSGETTVDKTIDLVANISGGTTPYTIEWTQIEGPFVAITAADAATGSVKPLAGGIYKFHVAVSDSSSVRRSGTAEVEFPVADIQFLLPASGATGPSVTVRLNGNPATVLVGTGVPSRAGIVDLQPRVSVYDPEYLDDQKTEMTVTYDIVSVPTAARSADVSMDRSFDTISNQGTGDVDSTGSGNLPALDAVVGIQIRPSPDITYKTITNLATLVDNFGSFAPGQYVFRVTVTNPAGVQRARDLIINLLSQDVPGPFGQTGDGGAAIAAGPDVVRVKALPTAGSKTVTDKIMTPDQTATMTVTVFPSSNTTYRFFLMDNVAVAGVAHPELVSPASTTVTADGAAHDIVLTIGKAGMAPGTYGLEFESFDGLGQLNAGIVTVNGTSTPVMFYVTNDYLKQTMLNVALVGAPTNDPDAPIQYKAWTGAAASYGNVSALADVNLDGALDIITFDTTTGGLSINVAGFVKGSTEALRHPTNFGNFANPIGGAGAAFTMVDPAGAVPGVRFDMAVGDLNGDNLPDIAVSGQDAGGVGFVEIFFHTGNAAAPYSFTAVGDQELVILPPNTDRRNQDVDTTLLTGGAVPVSKAFFGWKLGIADQNNDGKLDLIVTDPGFGKVKARSVAAPTPPAIAPPADNRFYSSAAGRVYVFAGGSTGELKPGRPDIITSLITERQLTKVNVFPTPATLSVTFAETAKKYALYYEGNDLEAIGMTLAVSDNGFAVGNPFVPGNGTYVGSLTIINPVADDDTVIITIGLATRTYQFDTTAFYNGVAAATPGATPAANRTVNLGTDNSPANAIGRLASVINDDDANYAFLRAEVDGARPEQLRIFYRYGALDGQIRFPILTDTFTNASNGVNAGGVFTLTQDGVVYRVAKAAAEGTLATAAAIKGTTNSNMGLGTVLAIGKYNGTTTADDLAIGARDAGTAAGATGDGAVFVLYNVVPAGPTTLGTALPVGAATLRGGGFVGPDVTVTNVGDSIAFGDVNGDGYDDLLFTEPGFDRVYIIFGAATPATTPTITFYGVQLSRDLPVGTGTFLFGDITADSYADWVFLNGADNFGFFGIQR